MSCSYARCGRSSRIVLAFSIFIAAVLPLSAQTISAPGLSAPGKISYDALGTPTIQAANEDDVAFLQGYAQAKARFFEMDFDRRAASGTLAELVGQPALANDVQSRTLGLRRAAWTTLAALDESTRGWLKAFSDGVNFWLQTQALPPEYGALMLTRAEPWSPVDSVTVGKGLAFQLSFDLDIQNTIDFGAYSQAAAAANVDAQALFFGDTHRFAPPDNHVTHPGFRAKRRHRQRFRAGEILRARERVCQREPGSAEACPGLPRQDHRQSVHRADPASAPGSRRQQRVRRQRREHGIGQADHRQRSASDPGPAADLHGNAPDLERRTQRHRP